MPKAGAKPGKEDNLFDVFGYCIMHNIRKFYL
jgi:hypothetical protein